MSKTVIYPALLIIILAAGCSYPARQQPSDPTKTSAERITVRGLSQDILTEAREIATDHCQGQDRQYTFIRNIFRKKSLLGVEWLTCDLYFACLKEGQQLPEMPFLPEDPEAKKPDTAEQPAPAKVDTAKAVPPKKDPNLDPYGLGEAESLGPEPLGPEEGQTSAAHDQGIIVEKILE